MGVIFLVLFLVTFLFDTRIGLVFLVLSIVTFFKGGASRRLTQIRSDQFSPTQKAWKDPWGTG